MCTFSCDIPTQPPLQQPRSAQASAVRRSALEVAGLIRTHAYYHAPRVVYSPVVVYRPAPVYYAPAPVYYTQPYPAWGAIGGAIAGAAIGSTVGRGNGRIASIAAGSMIGAAVGSQLDR